MKHFRNAVIAIGLLLTTPLATPAFAATYDGEWNVRIASTRPDCGNGATLAIGIRNGHVASNNAIVQASGRVADGGNISVTLMSGANRAIGSGHLSGSSGSGAWRGGTCSGTWTAQRI
jgi:hypothetical protein